MRKKLYDIISVNDVNSRMSTYYNVFNIIIILASLLPLMFKNQTPILVLVDQITVTFFIVEYLIHIFTADIRYPNEPKLKAFLHYPVSPLGIVDLLSILPSITPVNSTFRLLRLFRLLRSLRIFRAFKLFRYSRGAQVFINTIKSQKNMLTLIASLTFLYIIIVALIMFNVEPEIFPTFTEALTWSTMSLTSVTYGSTYPTTQIGQYLSMLSLLVGVVVIALPTSVITAGYIDELEKMRKGSSGKTDEENIQISEEGSDEESDLDKDFEEEQRKVEGDNNQDE